MKRAPWPRSDWFWIALLGLAAQLFWFWQIDVPTHMDAYYYTTNGQRLADGEGFTEMVIWQFLDEPPGLPAPSHTYWMPLPSLIAAAGYLVSDSFRAAQLPFLLLTATLPLLSYLISRHLFNQRLLAWLAALLTAAGGFYAAVWNQPETFAPFAWFGGAALLLGSTAGKARRLLIVWSGAGLLAGLAHLTRADGVLILFVLALLAGVDGRREHRPVKRMALTWSLLAGGYLLVVGPWMLHNIIVIGQLLPAAGTQTLFLTNYDELFSFGRAHTLAQFWEWGAANILRSRLDGIAAAIQTFVAVTGIIFLTPFIVVGWYHGWREPSVRRRLRPATWYTVLLFAVMSLLFTFPGMRGGLFHSSAAIWPWGMALAPAGWQRAIEWVAARRSTWEPSQAMGVFSAAFVILAFVVVVALGVTRVRDDGVIADLYPEIGAMLPVDAVVMVRNPPGFYYHTGRAAISVPNEPVGVLIAAAARYGVTHLVLDSNHPAPLSELFSDRSAPSLTLLADVDGIQLYAVAGNQK